MTVTYKNIGNGQWAPVTEGAMTEDKVEHHFAFLRMHLAEMNAENWRDMKLRCEQQLNALKEELGFWTPDRAGR